MFQEGTLPNLAASGADVGGNGGDKLIQVHKMKQPERHANRPGVPEAPSSKHNQHLPPNYTAARK